MILYTEPLTHQQKFIQDNSDIVINDCFNTNLFPSVCMAQACVESLYGLKHIGMANNYFGIKGSKKHQTNKFWDGRIVVKDTIENINNTNIKIKDGFRVYDSFEMSVKDRNRLLQTKHYAMVLTANTPEEQAQYIKDCGYATDPDYPKKLIWIIKKFQLKRLDEFVCKIVE